MRLTLTDHVINTYVRNIQNGGILVSGFDEGNYEIVLKKAEDFFREMYGKKLVVLNFEKLMEKDMLKNSKLNKLKKAKMGLLFNVDLVSESINYKRSTEIMHILRPIGESIHKKVPQLLLAKPGADFDIKKFPDYRRRFKNHPLGNWVIYYVVEKNELRREIFPLC